MSFIYVRYLLTYKGSKDIRKAPSVCIFKGLMAFFCSQWEKVKISVSIFCYFLPDQWSTKRAFKPTFYQSTKCLYIHGKRVLTTYSCIIGGPFNIYFTAWLMDMLVQGKFGLKYVYANLFLGLWNLGSKKLFSQATSKTHFYMNWFFWTMAAKSGQ